MNKLVTVTSRDYEKLKGEDVTLVFPLEGYSVGYEYYFNISEVTDYVLVNRLLNDEELDNLESILSSSNIKGIIFDDLGIIDIVDNLDIKKILLLDHIANNIKSINYYLDYVDSVVVSSDLEESEIRSIVSGAKKEVVVLVFGLKTLMYSRRNLVRNYEIYHHLENNDVLNVNIGDKKFLVVENEFGTKFYAYPYYNASSLLDLNNVLFFWYDPSFLSINNILNVINNNFDGIQTSRIFLDKKSIYKVGD